MDKEHFCEISRTVQRLINAEGFAGSLTAVTAIVTSSSDVWLLCPRLDGYRMALPNFNLKEGNLTSAGVAKLLDKRYDVVAFVVPDVHVGGMTRIGKADKL